MGRIQALSRKPIVLLLAAVLAGGASGRVFQSTTTVHTVSRPVLGSSSGGSPTPLAGSIVDGQIASNAAIATSKLADFTGIVAAQNLARLPTGYLSQSFPRNSRFDSNGNIGSQRLQLVGHQLKAGQVVSTVYYVTGSTGVTTPTNQWFGLWDSSRNKLRLTADDGATAWGASTGKTLYLSRSVTDAAITTGTATLTSATAAFTAGDVGKQVTVMGAGAAGVPLGTTAARVTVSSVTNATTAVLSANAGTTVASGGTAYIATPYTVPSDGLYYSSLVVKDSGDPNTAGITLTSGYLAINGLAPILGGYTTDSTLTTPASAPSTAGAMTADNAISYAALS